MKEDSGMDALELLMTRESALKLEAPGPSADELERIFASAVRAPDHGRLRPWQFVVINDDQRGAFGDLMAESMRRRDPTAGPGELARERQKAFRSPTIVAVVAKLKRGTTIPDVEQIASAAAAAQTIVLAAPALGYGAMWKTGAAAYDPFVKAALGLDEGDQIVGFLYIGTRAGGTSPIPRPQPVDFVTTWRG
jgi:nitroreductase